MRFVPRDEEVRYPQMRMNLCNAVAALADQEYQQVEWTERPRPEYWPGLDDVASYILDDIAVLDDTSDRLIGDVLMTGEELESIRALGLALDALLEDVQGSLAGTRGYAAATSSETWAGVVRAAEAARIRLGAERLPH
jgi:hypothetical protein